MLKKNSLWDIFRKKRYFVEKIPILGEGEGGGGLPTWEFFPHNTVFYSEDVPKSNLLKENGNSEAGEFIKMRQARLDIEGFEDAVKAKRSSVIKVEAVY